MKNTVFTFAVGISVFATTPDSAISPHVAVEHCIGCPPLVVRAVPMPKVDVFPVRPKELNLFEVGVSEAFAFRAETSANEPARFAVSVGHASLAMAHKCRGALRLTDAEEPTQNPRRALTVLAMRNLRPSTLESSFGVKSHCWAPAPAVSAKRLPLQNTRSPAIRTHVVRRPAGGYDQICQRSSKAIKCAFDDPSLVTFHKRLGAKLNQDDTMLVGDFRRFTAGIRVIRTFN